MMEAKPQRPTARSRLGPSSARSSSSANSTSVPVIDTAQAPAGAVANAVELERQLNPLSAINTDQVPAGAVANTVELQRQLDSVSAIGTNQVPAGAVANAVELQRQIGSVSTTGTSEAPAGAVANAMELQRQLDQQGAEVFDAGILDQNGGQPSELS